MKNADETLNAAKNRWAFGLGTIGRDMVYTMISVFLMFYLTDILQLSDKLILQVTMVILGARIFDALNDPVMGTIVDNTKSRWGKFKPWILIGALLSGILTVLVFTDFGIRGAKYIVLFSSLYIGWGITFTMNDISYWSMLPALSASQKEREKIGSIARICANIGLFSVVIGIDPITRLLGSVLAKNNGIDMQSAMALSYKIFSLAIVVLMWAFQSITVFGAKEPDLGIKKGSSEDTTLRGMIKIIFKNDQLLSVAASMTLFMIGYTTTTNFGLYFFKYAYGDQGMYSIFAAVLGLSQLLSLAFFPLLSKKWTRFQLYTGGTIGVAIGYIIFFFSPMNMMPIGIAGVFIFFSQALIQLLCLVFLADTVEYGQWKLGKRNESITFSIQPFIYKLSGAIASGITGFIVVVSGINSAQNSSDVSTGGLLAMKLTMLVFPMIMFILSYLMYKTTFKIDAAFFARIMGDLKKSD